MVVRGARCAEHCHHGVAGELVEGAAVIGDHLGHGRQVPTDEFSGPERRQLLGERGEAANVGEQDGRLDLLAERERGRGLLDHRCDFGWKEGRERAGEERTLLRPLGDRGMCISVLQDSTVLSLSPRVTRLAQCAMR